MKHYYSDLPRLGNVAISRHAQERCRELKITDHEVNAVLNNAQFTPDGHNVTFADHRGIRLVIINRPEPFRGAKLVTTAFRVEEKKRMR